MDAVIVVAGGKGVRMGGSVPKQFLPIGGYPVLMHTLFRIREALPDARIFVVLPADQQDYWRLLCDRYDFKVSHHTVVGGDTRFQSVKNGLNAFQADAESIIAIHDGVRPFVSTDVVRTIFDMVKTKSAIVPAINPVETVRTGDRDDSVVISRNACWLVQTPQAFKANIIREAYEQEFDEHFTDDASVVEAAGHKVSIVKGNPENIKLTTPIDLALAEVLLTRQNH